MADDGDRDSGLGQNAPIETPHSTDANEPSEGTNNGPAQPQVLGGFILDDEDDEEYTPTFHPAKPSNSVAAVDEEGDASQPPSRATNEPADSILPTNDSISNTVQKQDNSEAVANDQSVPQSAHTATPTLPSTAPSAVPENLADNINSEVDADSTSLYNPSFQQSSKTATPAVTSTSTSALKTRLPYDRVGILEDRIKEDPRGDIEAWLALIEEHRKRDKLDEARAVYERFFKVFPTAAEQWIAYSNMELEHNDFYRVEQIFNRSLLQVTNLQLWSAYLNYVRRRNNLTTDNSGNARKIVTEAYEFVLHNVGIDKDSGSLWKDYIQFIRSGPEQIGGTTWQDQQKMDTLRRVYQRAVCIPTSVVIPLWNEYETFEIGCNKLTGRKFLKEKSPSYMTARSSYTELQNLTKDLVRTTLPRLPPAQGFDGDVEYMAQVDIWKRWIEWEKEDPLVLKEENPTAYNARVLYVYKQAVMALRFWPEIWFDAAEYCYGQGLENDGNDFLSQGIAANPENCLLAFKRADRIESSSNKEEGQENLAQRGTAVREPFDKLLDALYELCTKAKQNETLELARIDETFGTDEYLSNQQDEDDDENARGKSEKKNSKAARTEAVKQTCRAHLEVLGKIISSVWIALMRAIRRVQGKGTPGEAVGGLRQTFADARKRGRLTPDVYIASALMEHYCYRDSAANRIFERGMKLYVEDARLPLAFIKYLISTNDVTNARSVFETTVTRLSQNPKLIPKTKILFKYLHEFESHYGELSQVKKLEARMKDMFPEDTLLQRFSSRFQEPDFDPIAVRLVISPATQTKPKSLSQPGIANISLQNSPLPSTVASPTQVHFSPKRQHDDSDAGGFAPRKLPRSDSPIKGAAGRRVDAQKRSQLRNQQATNGSHSTPPSTSIPVPPPPEVYRLMSILPKPELYGSNTTPFNAEKMAELIRNVDLSKAQIARSTPQPPHSQVPQNWQPPAGYGYQPQTPNFGYGR